MTTTPDPALHHPRADLDGTRTDAVPPRTGPTHTRPTHTGPTDTGPAVERLLDPDAEAYADAERYEVSLRTLLGAIEAVEDGPEPDHQS